MSNQDKKPFKDLANKEKAKTKNPPQQQELAMLQQNLMCLANDSPSNDDEAT